MMAHTYLILTGGTIEKRYDCVNVKYKRKIWELSSTLIHQTLHLPKKRA